MLLDPKTAPGDGEQSVDRMSAMKEDLTRGEAAELSKSAQPAPWCLADPSRDGVAVQETRVAGAVLVRLQHPADVDDHRDGLGLVAARALRAQPVGERRAVLSRPDGDGLDAVAS
jgi:hypothetical protein